MRTRGRIKIVSLAVAVMVVPAIIWISEFVDEATQPLDLALQCSDRRDGAWPSRRTPRHHQIEEMIGIGHWITTDQWLLSHRCLLLALHVGFRVELIRQGVQIVGYVVFVSSLKTGTQLTC
jgi:hypothetical protein